jgi:hypothetical protein
MRWVLSVVAAGFLAVGTAGCSDSSCCCESSSAKTSAATTGAKYKCSMDGGERDTPGPCPTCGMTLSEKK